MLSWQNILVEMVRYLCTAVKWNASIRMIAKRGVMSPRNILPHMLFWKCFEIFLKFRNVKTEPKHVMKYLNFKPLKRVLGDSCKSADISGRVCDICFQFFRDIFVTGDHSHFRSPTTLPLCLE